MFTFLISYASGEVPIHNISGPAIVINDLRWRDRLGTLIGVTGNSGNADASAVAPRSLVRAEIPTKNSLPVNRTSPPSIMAFESAISKTDKLSSFLSMALIVST